MNPPLHVRHTPHTHTHTLSLSQVLRGAFPTVNATGFNVTADSLELQIWHTYLAIGELHPENLSLIQPLQYLRPRAVHNYTSAPALTDWLPCTPAPVYNAGNNSLTQALYLGGAEDPRLFLTNDDPTQSLHLTFSSFLPMHEDENGTLQVKEKKRMGEAADQYRSGDDRGVI